MAPLQQLLSQELHSSRSLPTTNPAAVSSIINVLSTPAGRFLKDPSFRRHLHTQCTASITPAGTATPPSLISNLLLAINTALRLADQPPADTKIKSLRNSIRLLSLAASINSPGTRSAYTCGIPNSHLSACAHLYLSIIYKIERNDKASAGHLLQTFCHAPLLARRNLLPDLWDHFFLPHLLHLKVWYTQEVELSDAWDADRRDQRLKSLSVAYNDRIDAGTVQFALYYKEWLKGDATAKVPPVPSIPLPSRPSSARPSERRSVSLPIGSSDRSLYQAVFGSSSLELQKKSDASVFADTRIVAEDARDRGCRFRNLVHSDVGVHQRRSNSMQGYRTSEAAVTARKSYSFRIFSCRTDPNRSAVCHAPISKNLSCAIATEPNRNISSKKLSQAISLISYSDSLQDCETAIRVIAKSWLDCNGDSSVETSLYTPSVIEGLLETTFASKDDQILELAISVIAELVARNEINRQVVLNADPQLEIFLKLLRSNVLSFKAAALLYLLKPKAKQMLSLDWIPLALHVLENGDQIQTLFSVRCSPKSGTFYFLDQLLMGFDIDRNVENAKQLVAIGGLNLLIRRLEMGDAREKKSCSSLLYACVKAEGACRSYLAANIAKESIIQILVLNKVKPNRIALSLLCELICLNRISQIIKFLNGLKNDGCLNAMHVLLVYLQQAPVEQRPLAAAILLQLDLLGDPLQHSIYREEGIDAIVEALEYCSENKKLQQQCSRSLLLFGSRFSFMGETMTEIWLLKKAGLDDGAADFINNNDITENATQEEEEKSTEDWLRRLAIILLTSGGNRLLVALSNCIADGIPCLGRSCLVTVAWMSNSLSCLQNANSLLSLACLILAPQLLVSLSYDRATEERVLASLSLLNFVKHSDGKPGSSFYGPTCNLIHFSWNMLFSCDATGIRHTKAYLLQHIVIKDMVGLDSFLRLKYQAAECLPMLYPLDKETVHSLQDLSRVTWTAKELLTACCR